ncbi:MAG: hypothetical protein WC325_09670 [Candidatus Bathyarchaeia archaeon]
MRQWVTFLVVALLFLASLVTAFLVNYSPIQPIGAEKPFYFGVSFGGETIQEAKTLIDRVKGFTNLFIMQSGALMDNTTAVNEIGDYAVSNNLTYAVYGDVDRVIQSQAGIDYSIALKHTGWVESWIDTADERWGDKFLGLYYGDEPGGRMLDKICYLVDSASGADVKKDEITISVFFDNGIKAYYAINGDVCLRIPETLGNMTGFMSVYFPWNSTLIRIDDVPAPTQEITSNYPVGTGFMWVPFGQLETVVNYYANGTVTVSDTDGIFYTPENGSTVISQFDSYSEVLEKNPIKNMDDAAQTFVTCNANNIDWLASNNVTLFTSDYGLYWWDYLSGYDFVLAQLGWNNTAAQEIGLVRGAANMQNKSWGTIITWTYQNAPYLASAQEIYNQMRLSYECGAEYVVVFNYAPDMDGEYGILTQEHLTAMEQFWTDIVNNPDVKNGNIKAEAVLVLPHDYGWGMRTQNDKIWGIWNPDQNSEQIWNLLQENLAKYGAGLDIVYDDTQYPVAGKYPNTCYWNQTN